MWAKSDMDIALWAACNARLSPDTRRFVRLTPTEWRVSLQGKVLFQGYARLEKNKQQKPAIGFNVGDWADLAVKNYHFFLCNDSLSA